MVQFSILRPYVGFWNGVKEGDDFVRSDMDYGYVVNISNSDTPLKVGR
jgi:hypothetical protein